MGAPNGVILRHPAARNFHGERDDQRGFPGTVFFNYHIDAHGFPVEIPCFLPQLRPW